MAPTIAELATARLPVEFYTRDVLDVAPALIGQVLVHRQRAGIIVETEAYRGTEDLASHARFGPTARTEVMFGRGGIAYVYLCYGIHEMFNIVTGTAGTGEAVLIRAIAPLVGLPEDPTVGRGPGKVTRALGLDRRHDRRDLARGALYVAAPPSPVPFELATGPRVGVAYAKQWAAHPYRFWWRDHPSVSATPAAASRGTSATRRKR
ncbi:MAG: DNA-3-methyladenine glycosylase [Kofleriaceae bacterium]